ncbi:hypothetical protein O181_031739 [Austropuccinia psidii MF-1]|uniref:Uncharacterized protein n=1 Tax=Austropuccinia psidii MF-1 TaxID=1389203 RepID=A0A9Q3H6V6_9BASI|nr:hypothetical protein [Austropuccinia psidii MF-1]
MVNTRNVSNCSVQPGGSEQGRGKTRTTSGRPSSRKAHLEDARVSLHSPRSVPTTLDINSEPELIQGKSLRVEPLPSGSHRNISVPVQNAGTKQPRMRIGKLVKAFSGGNEVLLTHQEPSLSGEEHRTLRSMESLFMKRQGQKDKELAEEPNYFIHRPEERVRNDPRLGERRISSINKLQPSSITVQRQAKCISEETESSQEQ